MLDESDVRATLAAALASGGDWAEVYAERRDSTGIRIDDRRVEELSSGHDQGAGVRVVKDAQAMYAYTNVLTHDALLEAARAAAAGLSGAQRATVADLTRAEPPTRHPVRLAPDDVDKARKIEVTRRCEEAAWAAGGDVRQVTASYADVSTRAFVANSLGHLSDETQVRTRLVVHVVAARDGLMQTGFEGPGASKGFEHFDEIDPATVGRTAAERALRLLDSDPSPAGEMTVVLNAGGGGVLFHEACGHGLEADALAKETSVYAPTRGQQVGSELLTGVDDATLPNGWGSFAFDGEGTPAQRTVLFDRGVQVGEMSDRISAGELGTAPTGNGRRQSYAHLPQPRMTNSLILPGGETREAILRSVARGLYADGLAGGEVNPATGDFVFGVTEAYLIEDGELTRRVRGANLIGNGPHVLRLVDAVGDDLATKQGMCGKGGQWVPAGFGTPTLRIARLTVGGTA
ncbi:MAG TPA: TldD/PmbA family protein [Mycobacteriales bacterium]|nr:TldD/PmbA family protein [Mycobacteriales bacterium]